MGSCVKMWNSFCISQSFAQIASHGMAQQSYAEIICSLHQLQQQVLHHLLQPNLHHLLPAGSFCLQPRNIHLQPLSHVAASFACTCRVRNSPRERSSQGKCSWSSLSAFLHTLQDTPSAGGIESDATTCAELELILCHHAAGKGRRFWEPLLWWRQGCQGALSVWQPHQGPLVSCVGYQQLILSACTAVKCSCFTVIRSRFCSTLNAGVHQVIWSGYAVDPVHLADQKAVICWSRFCSSECGINFKSCWWVLITGSHFQFLPHARWHNGVKNHQAS